MSEITTKQEDKLPAEIVLLQNGHPDLAIPLLDAKLAKDPNNWQHHVNIGIAYRLTNNFLLALLHQNLAVQIKPEAPQAWHNLGITNLEVGDFDASFLAHHKAHSLAPDNQQVCLAFAYALMREGKLELAWPLWEQARFRKSFFPMPGIPLWTGEEDLHGKKILVMYEGGYGDAIFFLRWFPELQDRGAEVYFQVPDEQGGIFQGHTWLHRVVPASAPIHPKDFDFCVSNMSLPALVGCKPEAIPMADKYILAHPRDIETYRYVLGDGTHDFRVGICWGAEENGVPKRSRSIKDEELEPLKGLGISWYCLFPDHALPWMSQPGMSSWSDTAAIIHHLDAVVSVDTAVLHLAAAMGKPTYGIVPLSSDWKWSRKGEDSHWYPSLKLIRNDHPTSFAGAISALSELLVRATRPHT